MGQVLKRQKGTYGIQRVAYRHIDGNTFAAQITGTTALGVPGTPTITVVGASGAANYSYRISALTVNGETTVGTAGTTATGNATLNGSNFNRVSWTAVAGATGYRVYGRTGGSELLMATIQVTTIGGSAKVGGGTVNGTGSGDGFEDTGTVTPAGALPGSNSAVLYNIFVPALKPAGVAQASKTNIGVVSQRNQTNGLVVGR